MTPRPASKTHRFLETLGLMALATSWFDVSQPLAWNWSTLSLGIHVVAALIAVSALVHRPLRKAAWVAFVVAGMVSLVASGASLGGPLLVLCGVYLIFDSQWPGRWSPVVSWFLVALVLAAQGVALLGSLDLVVALGHWLVVDILLVTLALTFRHEVFVGTDDRRPVVHLADFGLSARETQIVRCLWDGYSVKEIAHELDLAHGTVRTYLTQLYRKLRVEGLRELTLLGHTHRIEFAPADADADADADRKKKMPRRRVKTEL